MNKNTFPLKKFKNLQGLMFFVNVESYDIFATISFILQLKFVYIRVWVLYLSNIRSC